MLIGEVLKEVRHGKKLSQADIEFRTGLIREYISRVENGHTIPSLPTLEKLAVAMEVPLWQIIRGTNGGTTPPPLVDPREDGIPPGVRSDVRNVERAMLKMSVRNRKLLVGLARKMAR